jgi:protein SCO1/2
MTARNRIIFVVLGIFAVIIVAFLAISWLRPPEFHGTLLQSPDLPADFTLINEQGEEVHLRDLRGKWTLLYFGYTFCPDVCPTTLADLRAMNVALGNKADNAQVVFVSLDPERDTPERMAAYTDAFDPSFIGLTGSPAAIDAAATQFGVFYEKHEAEGASGYLIDHTSTVSLLDPKGYVRMVFPYGVPGEDIAADLAYFMRRG